MAHKMPHAPPAKTGGKPTKADLTQTPIEHLDLEKVTNLADLLDGYAKISFQARTLGQCAQILERMMLDPKATVFFGGAGALVPGGLRKVLRDLVEFGLVDVMVTTGAIAYHDFYEAHGHRHYRSSPDADDIVLREHFLDRVYDTLADESLFRECDAEIATMADNLEPGAYSSRQILAMMGERAAKDPNSLVGACYRRGIPYFVPALNDSSIGIALTRHHRDRARAKKPMVHIDAIKDNYEIAQVKLKSPRSGVFYVGGGTPKNYISQVEVIQEVLGYEENPHWYAVQITTDVPQWGGLSGCTFEESQSWGKFQKEAKMAQSLVEATIGLPLLVGYLLQKGVHKKRTAKKFTWKGDDLVKLA
ncbi:MAG: deoxyhypusine synthase [Methanobacteriota archaeon]|nr:MAG: deoxyhypusine synthase [Euryarchaeota archaeon]